MPCFFLSFWSWVFINKNITDFTWCKQGAYCHRGTMQKPVRMILIFRWWIATLMVFFIHRLFLVLTWAYVYWFFEREGGREKVGREREKYLCERETWISSFPYNPNKGVYLSTDSLNYAFFYIFPEKEGFFFVCLFLPFSAFTFEEWLAASTSLPLYFSKVTLDMAQALSEVYALKEIEALWPFPFYIKLFSVLSWPVSLILV